MGLDWVEMDARIGGVYDEISAELERLSRGREFISPKWCLEYATLSAVQSHLLAASAEIDCILTRRYRQN